MQKKLAIVGAGEAALPIIKKAREMQIETLAFGGSDSLAKEYVDCFVDESIFDVDAMERICRLNNVNGVIASSEKTTESAAILAKRLGLPGNQYKGIFPPKNKYLMRECVKNLKNVFQPEYYCYKGEPISSFPVMIKATDSCGKMGISLVKTKDELQAALSRAKAASSDESVLVEDYIPGGREFSVECLANNNEKYIIQITEKITSGPPYFTEIAHHQPAELSSYYKQAIYKATEDILSCLGITCGMAHLEIKLINGKIFFIEVGARAGGDHIADILTYLSTDYDYYKGAIQCCYNELETPIVHNVANSGIYFHCVENNIFEELFKSASNENWCVKNTVETDRFTIAKGNVEASKSGYIIYCSNHKIGLGDTRDGFKAELLNYRKDAFKLIWDHNKEIGRDLSDKELEEGVNKFIAKGNAIGVVKDNHLIAFLVLYCNHYESLEAYICNVDVLPEFRGKGLCGIILEKAFEISREKGFKSIQLHVAEDNFHAISVYDRYGFVSNGNFKDDNGEKQIEMVVSL